MLQSFAQDTYQFTPLLDLKASSVKNQGNSGTCWSFATCSMMESEKLISDTTTEDISEMYFVRNAYVEKAINYVRLHGKANFGQGGEAHDVMNIAAKYGAVPQSVFNGKKDNDKYYDHESLENDLKNYLDSLLAKNKDELPDEWLNGFEKILDKQFGKCPASFEYKEKKYTPKTYLSEYLKIDPSDYIEFTSYTHHPFYKPFFLEIPDNWSFNLYNNIPMDELIEIIDSSLARGHTVGWGGDVSEKEFSGKKGIAIVPKKDWKHKSDKEQERTLDVPEKELTVTQEMRQQSFDNYRTTDDHFMHIVGTAKDQNGNKYYIAKNSWGLTNGKEGCVYLSVEYVKLKTISIMVKKEMVPVGILKSCGIQ